MLAIVLALFVMDIALWIIDIHDAVTELDITLISISSESLSERYQRSQQATGRFALVEDTLYAYMVGCLTFRIANVRSCPLAMLSHC